MLLERDEPPAVEVINAEGGSRAVLVCDHASNRVPRRLANLGLEPALLADHIAWDPGAAEVARRLSVHLDAPLVLSGYSRLVVDCNRLPSRADSIPEQSAGVPIPGNSGLSPKDREIRIEALFQPYHRAITRLLDGRSRQTSLFLSIHSFTPVLGGMRRPWPIGISYGRNPRLARLMRDGLTHSVNESAHEGVDNIVGDNEPYPIEDDVDYTIPVHGEGRGLPSVMVEIRQDGIRSAAGVDAWAARLAEAYRLIETEAAS